MKGKIDKDGYLWLERAGKLKPQFCEHEGPQECGDWCPCFQEPVVTTLTPIFRKLGQTTLIICEGNTLVFDEFTDERGY